MHGGLRRENDRIYAEMFKEGIEPFRGTWRSLSVMVVAFLIAVVSMMLGFYVVLGGPVWIFEDILRSITRG